MTQKILSMIGMLVLAGCSAQASDLGGDNPIYCSMAFASASVAVKPSDSAEAQDLTARALLVPGAAEAKRFSKARETEILTDFHARPNARAKLIQECSATQEAEPGFSQRLAAAKEELRLRQGLGERAIAADDPKCAIVFSAVRERAKVADRDPDRSNEDEVGARLAYELAGTPRDDAAWDARMRATAEALEKEPQLLDQHFHECRRRQDADELFRRELPRRARVAYLMNSRISEGK